ncbi:MAG: hypothetical protein SFZ03_04510 [Candidatus Melainabacteria bacterium]|nr:hypothetical protein [Candidatus Melainabacteria bacterium]
MSSWMAPIQPGFSTAGPLSANRATQGVSPVAFASPSIQTALGLLSQVTHRPEDIAYLRWLGVDLLYTSGAEALQAIQQRGASVVFGDLGDTTAHAEWRATENRIVINQRYQGDTSPATLYGIAAAIYHEAGHVARLGDGSASVQEEVNCLALNVLAHRYFSQTSPAYQFAASQSRLITDGVALYDRLFFDPSVDKLPLIHRVISKYGMLPLASADHPLVQTPGFQLARRVGQTLREQYQNVGLVGV